MFGLAIIIWIVGMNAFPQNTLFATKDILAPIHAWENKDYYFMEGQGRGFLVYGIFALLDGLGWDSGTQLTWYLGFFLFGSFLSLWWALGKLFKKIPLFVRTAFSLAYTLNIYTLSLFFSGEVFAPSHTLYVILPALTASFILAYTQFSRREIVQFLFFFFLASSSFLFPQMAVISILYLGMLVVLCEVFLLRNKEISWKRKGEGILAMGMGVLLLSAYWIFPVVKDIQYGKTPEISQNFVNVSWELQESSVSFLQTFRWFSSQYTETFPYWFPYEDMTWLRSVLLLLTVIPLGWMILGWLAFDKKDAFFKRYFWFTATLLIIIVFLASRLLEPFAFINKFFFSLPGVAVLSSGGVFLMFAPFLGILLGVLSAFLWQGYNRYIGISACLIVLSAFPFFLGGIHQKTSPLWGEEVFKNDRWENVGASAITRLPKEYKDIENILKEEDAGKILRLPYQGGDVTGWERESYWGLYAKDIAPILFSREVLSAQIPYFDRWLHAKTFATSKENPTWLTTLFGLTNTSHILLYKNGGEYPSEEYEQKLHYLEQSKNIENIYETQWYTLWRISESSRFGRVFVSDNAPPLIEDPSSIYASVNKIQNMNPREIVCQRGDGWKKGCSFTITSEEKGKVLTLGEPFHGYWSALLLSQDGSQKELQHMRSFGFLNGWKLPNSLKAGDQVVIAYAPERFENWGWIISLGALVCVIIGGGLISLRKLL